MSTSVRLWVYDMATGRELPRLLHAEYRFAALATDARGTVLAVGLPVAEKRFQISATLAAAWVIIIIRFRPHPRGVHVALMRPGPNQTRRGRQAETLPPPASVAPGARQAH
jgi:hypothetical protein